MTDWMRWLAWEPTPEPAQWGTVLAVLWCLALVALLLAGLGWRWYRRWQAAAQRLAQTEQQMQALEYRQQDYVALTRHLPGVLLRVQASAPWRVLQVNHQLQALTGYTQAELLNQPWLDSDALTPAVASDKLRVQQMLEALSCEQPTGAELEVRVRHHDGSTRWLLLHAYLQCAANGTPEYINALLLDITSRKLAEADLHQAQSIIQGSDDAIVSKTVDGIITSWNQGAERIFGYTAQEAVGQSMLMLFPEDRLAEERAILERICQRQKVPTFETVRRCKDGRLIDISVTLSPILDTQGEVVGASKIARDISERKRNHELQVAKDRAEQAAAARSAFLANMSHELRTPMNSVLGFTHLLLDTPLSDEQRKYLNTVHNSASSLLRLLNDILDSAKLDKGALELEVADFDLLSLLRELEDSYALTARQKGVAFKVQCAPEVKAHYRGDSLRVRQVLTNLLGNAVKFTEHGEVELSVAEEVQGVQQRLHFTVKDTGIGMTPEQLHCIFDPFTQADASMSRRFGGTGLGTTISKQLVDLMGGRIWIESELGRGSAFHVVLPLADAVHPSAALPERAEDIVLPALRLLLVDDVALNLQLLALLMKKEGHTVTTVNNGEAAVHKATHQPFDLVLMDVQMPGMSGLEATQHIRHFEVTHARTSVPIIALTASVLLSDRQAAHQAGMDGFATKPIELKQLKAEMARVLGIQPGGTAPVAVSATPVWLDEVAGVELWSGCASAWREALGHLYRHLPEQLERIVQGVREHNPQVEVWIHQLRGSASALALMALVQVLERLEKAWQHPSQLHNLVALTAQFEIVVARTLAAMQAHVNTPALPSPAHVAEEVPCDVPLVQTLAASMRQQWQAGECDPATVQALHQALGSVATPLLWEPFYQAVQAFEFEQAQTALDALLARCPVANTPLSSPIF